MANSNFLNGTRFVLAERSCSSRGTGRQREDFRHKPIVELCERRSGEGMRGKPQEPEVITLSRRALCAPPWFLSV